MKPLDGIRIQSEIGRLKRVLLHRPGLEIENLTPDLMDRLLFDDIPYLKIAREEHDAFAEILCGNGVEVLYLEQLAAESIVDPEVKRAFLDEYLSEAGLLGPAVKDALLDYFYQFSDNLEMVNKMMAGVRREELDIANKKTLSGMVAAHYPFIVDPMPNLYFTRDPFAAIGSGISLNHMRTVTRNRETLFAKYIFDHHPEIGKWQVPRWYERDMQYAIEGGDQLVLSDKVLAVGVSERTDAAAIDILAERVFADNQPFETILALDIPKKRAFMHLDTVFTMVDRDKFTIHPEIEGPLTVYSLKKNDGKIKIEEEAMELEDILKKYLHLDKVSLIRCGGGNVIDAGREQWNDGSNTLAIAPGEVVVYSRNHVTNHLLEEAGVKLHEMPSSELSRGRGGPRCMSMPLYREDL